MDVVLSSMVSVVLELPALYREHVHVEEGLLFISKPKNHTCRPRSSIFSHSTKLGYMRTFVGFVMQDHNFNCYFRLIKANNEF